MHEPMSHQKMYAEKDDEFPYFVEDEEVELLIADDCEVLLSSLSFKWNVKKIHLFF